MTPYTPCDCTDQQPSATVRPCGCVVCVTCGGIVEWGHHSGKVRADELETLVNMAFSISEGPAVACPHLDDSWYVSECDPCLYRRILTEILPVYCEQIATHVAMTSFGTVWDSGPRSCAEFAANIVRGRKQ